MGVSGNGVCPIYHQSSNWNEENDQAVDLGYPIDEPKTQVTEKHKSAVSQTQVVWWLVRGRSRGDTFQHTRLIVTSNCGKYQGGVTLHIGWKNGIDYQLLWQIRSLHIKPAHTTRECSLHGGNGMEWNEMKWNGMEWNGMEWGHVGQTIFQACNVQDLKAEYLRFQPGHFPVVIFHVLCDTSSTYSPCPPLYFPRWDPGSDKTKRTRQSPTLKKPDIHDTLDFVIQYHHVPTF